jgi:hypothetical protein
VDSGGGHPASVSASESVKERDDVPHLTSEELSAYVSRTLSDLDLDRLDGHLDSCGECRDELVGVSTLLGSARRARRVRTTGGIGLAAAAVGGILLLGPNVGQVLSEQEPVLRDGSVDGEEGVRGFGTVEPADGAWLGSLARSVFVWSEVAPGAFYSLTVTDERGDLVWTGTTTDTLVRLPADLDAEPGGRYFWFVEALLADGTTATTDASRFWTEP